MKRSAHAIIDTAALRHNLARCREVAPNSLAMAVIKANAYGHNMLKAAETLSHANGFAVSCLQEALELRQARFIHPIVVLQGFHTMQSMKPLPNTACELSSMTVINWNCWTVHLPPSS